jgi:hypothetical protein
MLGHLRTASGRAPFTTMVVQGFDLAMFLPPSLMAGFR